MQVSLDRVVEVEESDVFLPLEAPAHPAFQHHLAEIALIRVQRGPSAAADACIEVAIVVSRLLELATAHDPETVDLLDANGITTSDLEHLELWLDQRAREIALEIC
jgi:hypothetical protein